MYQLIVRSVLCALLGFTSLAVASDTKPRTNLADDISISKQLAKTPLIKGENFKSYLREDKKLNSAYRSLYVTLDDKKRPILKGAQREWIEWRAQKCTSMQEKIACGTVGCYGVVHDDCIIQMTLDRTLELRDFAKNIDEGAKKHFDFSRINKYLDDD